MLQVRDGKCEKERTVPISMSRIPQDLAPPRRKGRARAMAGVDPPQRCQGKRWRKPHALTSNRASVVVVTSVFTNTKMQLLPQRIQNVPIGLHQRRRPAQTLRHASQKRYACIAKGKRVAKGYKCHERSVP